MTLVKQCFASAFLSPCYVVTFHLHALPSPLPQWYFHFKTVRPQRMHSHTVNSMALGLLFAFPCQLGRDGFLNMVVMPFFVHTIRTSIFYRRQPPPESRLSSGGRVGTHSMINAWGTRMSIGSLLPNGHCLFCPSSFVKPSRGLLQVC